MAKNSTRLDLSPAGSLLQAAFASHQAGQLAEAERLYRQVLAHQPRNFDALRFLGVIAGLAGNWGDGSKLLRDALKIQPQSVEAHADLGGLLHGDRKLDEAATSLTTAIRLNPQYYSAHYNLGVVRRDQGRFVDAAASFGAAIGLKPDAADAWYNLGISWQAQGKYDDATLAYRRALHIIPGRLDIHCALGGLLFETGDYPGAAEAYRAALAIQDDFPNALNGLAAAQAENEEQEAIETIDRAIRAIPDNVYAYDLLGMIRKRQGRFAEAIQAHEAAIALPGNHSYSYYGLSLVRKFTAADQGIVDGMLSAVGQPDLSASDRSLVYFGLGKVFDDLSRYEEAMAHFDLANRAWLDARPPHLKQQSIDVELRQRSALVDSMTMNFDASNIQRMREWGSSSEKPIFIVGMMRSGTTLVEQILASHPDVAAGGELTFWNDRRMRLGIGSGDTLRRADAERAIRDYLEVLSGISLEAPRVTDKMPHNVYLAGLLHVLFPQARMVHCRRNPVDTCLSIYSTRFARGQEFSYDRAAIVSVYTGYLRLAAHWRRVLPADRFIEIDYENLVADQEGVSRDLVRFCGLEWTDSCLSFHEKDRSIYTASAWQARQPIYRSSTERWRNYEPWLGVFGDLPTSGFGVDR